MEYTGITGANRVFFSHIVPMELLEKAGSFGFFGIGAAEGQRPQLKGAAALIFCIREDAQGVLYVTIEWLFVREDLRRQGIAAELLAELEKDIQSRNPESVSIDLPVEGHSDIKGLLKKLGYRSAYMRVPFFELSVREARGRLPEPYGTDDKGDLVPLIESGISEIKRAAKKLYRDRYIEDLGFIVSQPEDYFEPEVSFVHINRGETDGWILVRKEPDDILSIVSFEGTEGASIATMRELLAESMDAMQFKYGNKRILQIPIRSEEELEHLEQYISGGKQRMVERFVKPLEY
jgi:GNAT superfamily N-acetyltransferase